MPNLFGVQAASASTDSKPAKELECVPASVDCTLALALTVLEWVNCLPGVTELKVVLLQVRKRLTAQKAKAKKSGAAAAALAEAQARAKKGKGKGKDQAHYNQVCHALVQLCPSLNHTCPVDLQLTKVDGQAGAFACFLYLLTLRCTSPASSISSKMSDDQRRHFMVHTACARNPSKSQVNLLWTDHGPWNAA